MKIPKKVDVNSIKEEKLFQEHVELLILSHQRKVKIANQETQVVRMDLVQAKTASQVTLAVLTHMSQLERNHANQEKTVLMITREKMAKTVNQATKDVLITTIQKQKQLKVDVEDLIQSQERRFFAKSLNQRKIKSLLKKKCYNIKLKINSLVNHKNK